tara:strand:- start:210 stop:371 length:162 start_codon:yes stop_codon:yes gene_type:complete
MKVSIKEIEYINFIMKQINNHTDCVYESLMDQDIDSLNYNIKILIEILKDIRK